jgi:hypothetical protein
MAHCYFIHSLTFNPGTLNIVDAPRNFEHTAFWTPLFHENNMNLSNMTLEEAALQFSKFVQDNIGTFTNDQLATLLAQLNSLQAASVKQYDINLEKEKESNQDILDKYIIVANRSEHSMYNVVSLNVGGRTFSTFKETLIKLESTYFYVLLNSVNFNSGPDGSYFIDRDPAHFGLIVTFLRTGDFPHREAKKYDNLGD